jgi:hypothetical protein
MGTFIDDINKPTPAAKPKPVEEYVGPMFKTVIKNSRDGDAVLQDDNGGNWLRLSAGESITLASWSPKTMYAPYSKVVFEKNGTVNATRRFGFRDPTEDVPYSILLDNRAGGELEVISINGEYVSVVKGVPRRVPISLIDPRIGYRAIVWKKKTVKEPIPGNRDYLQTRTIVERVMVGRRAAELRAIKKELEKRAVLEARENADRAFKRITPVEVEEDAETPSAE